MDGSIVQYWGINQITATLQTTILKFVFKNRLCFFIKFALTLVAHIERCVICWEVNILELPDLQAHNHFETPLTSVWWEF